MVVSLFTPKSETVDIHLHDTYFVITLRTVYGLFIGLFLLCALLYRLTEGRLAFGFLTWYHVVVTLMTGLFLISPVRRYAINPRQYYNLEPWQLLQTAQSQYRFMALVVLLFLTGQLAFLINVGTGTYRGRLVSR